MVRHIDIAKRKLKHTKFTLEKLGEVLGCSYGLARKEALQWVEDGQLHRFDRHGRRNPHFFQFDYRKLAPEQEPKTSLDDFMMGESLSEIEEVLEAIDPNDPWFNAYSLEEQAPEAEEEQPKTGLGALLEKANASISDEALTKATLSVEAVTGSIHSLVNQARELGEAAEDYKRRAEAAEAALVAFQQTIEAVQSYITETLQALKQ